MSKKIRVEDFEPLSGVNIIPVIDVSLVLLIILLATSPILNQPGFKLELPKARTSESKEKNITVSLSLKDEMAVNESPARSLDEVGPLIAKELGDKKDLMVIIRADQGVPYGKVQALMDIAKNVGAEKIAIATQQLEDKPQ
jgi:biopolymer transport protein TolR